MITTKEAEETEKWGKFQISKNFKHLLEHPTYGHDNNDKQSRGKGKISTF